MIVFATIDEHSLSQFDVHFVLHAMYPTGGSDVLEFKVDYKVKKKVKDGFLGWRSKSEDFAILNDGER